MIEEFPRLVSGLIFGIVFGFLLQKGRLAKFGVLVRQFTLQDWTVAKVLVTAILVGGVGVYAMLPGGAVSLSIEPLALGGLLVGGLSFGVGMAIFGYCPGTGVAAVGEGRLDAMVGVLGGLFGAGIYVLAWQPMQTVENWMNQGPLTIPEVTGLRPWLVFAIATMLALVLGAAIRVWSRGSAKGGPQDPPPQMS